MKSEKMVKPVLIALTQKMVLSGYSLRKTAKMLNITEKTASKYNSMLTDSSPDSLQMIDRITDSVLKDTNTQLITKTAKKLQEKLKLNPSISDLTNLYEVTNKVGKPVGPSTAIQFNSYSTQERNEFGL